ncbi:glycerol-3-phosphate cytidylyltransferase [Olegusella massiliensis]|uniref:glycerol-3-phosphate cytidylyltransferase n=1 Tax=Olegusella massiliensis TaxID=1776381 RepID=UPI00083876F7|nr:glycerol-3-phosphate cytidylyltransferase [Olegusella massiliensis]MBS5865187.1 glycerol-3-phosphate cytidylyltransferase [Coriobacteriaceae bacterium]
MPYFEGNGEYTGLKRVLTYGTFDLLHYGHIRLLRRAAALGDYLVVALSTDEFNQSKGKTSFYDYETRKEMLEAIRYVDLVIPEKNWEQKLSDVKDYHIDTVVMGGDWAGSNRFEYLKKCCDVVYLDRTPGISTTDVKGRLQK